MSKYHKLTARITDTYSQLTDDCLIGRLKEDLPARGLLHASPRNLPFVDLHRAVQRARVVAWVDGYPMKRRQGNLPLLPESASNAQVTELLWRVGVAEVH